MLYAFVGDMWLVRHFCPKDHAVASLCCGTGTTLIAAALEGVPAVGVDTYILDAAARLAVFSNDIDMRFNGDESEDVADGDEEANGSEPGPSIEVSKDNILEGVKLVREVMEAVEAHNIMKLESAKSGLANRAADFGFTASEGVGAGQRALEWYLRSLPNTELKGLWWNMAQNDAEKLNEFVMNLQAASFDFAAAAAAARTAVASGTEVQGWSEPSAVSGE